MMLNPRFLFITASMLIVISTILCFRSEDTNFASARKIIVMRNIGHQILLSSGDRTSRVLPVNKTGTNQYLIRFESPLKFIPDSIVKIIKQGVEANRLTSDYLVNVIECGKNEIVYGFGVLKSEQTNLVACRGRKQPKACYSIEITFRDTALSTIKDEHLISVGGGLTALILILSGLKINYRQKGTRGSLKKTALFIPEGISIGNYTFNRDDQYLQYDNEQIDLSDKESKLLYILSRKPNELIERSELQKVWEDEGVIVGRSLDMFISKLRKKLVHDPKVQLVNVHGKGYKLQIS